MIYRDSRSFWERKFSCLCTDVIVWLFLIRKRNVWADGLKVRQEKFNTVILLAHGQRSIVNDKLCEVL